MSDEKIIYILDTNILLHEPFAFLSFKEHDVVVPMTVLEELDSIKDYRTDQLIDDIQFLTKGYHEFEGGFWQQVNVCESQTEGRNTTHIVSKEAVPIKIKHSAKFLQKNIINNLLFINQNKTSSKLNLGECYV